MNELYWITVLGNLNGLGTAAIIVGLANIIIGLTIYGDWNSCKKLFKFSCVGIGSTIDYIKENPIAKQLPDKCIKILNKWADKQLKEND